VSARVRVRAPAPEPRHTEFFAALVKARIPAVRERARLLRQLLEREAGEEGPLGGWEGEALRRERERVLAAAEGLARSLEDVLSRYGASAVAPPPPAPGASAARLASELAMLLDDMADFAAESGDPALVRMTPRLRRLAAEVERLF
jgi:hypothetical protein